MFSYLMCVVRLCIIIIIIKRISTAPIYRTRWEHRALYNNTNKNTHTHTHARTHAHTHTHTHTHIRTSDEGIGTAVKKQFRNNS